MIDLTNITPEQANKIEMVLIMFQDDLEQLAVLSEQHANDTTLSDHVRSVSRSNAQWYREAYNLIYGN